MAAVSRRNPYREQGMGTRRSRSGGAWTLSPPPPSCCTPRPHTDIRSVRRSVTLRRAAAAARRHVGDVCEYHYHIHARASRSPPAARRASDSTPAEMGRFGPATGGQPQAAGRQTPPAGPDRQAPRRQHRPEGTQPTTEYRGRASADAVQNMLQVVFGVVVGTEQEPCAHARDASSDNDECARECLVSTFG